MGRITPATLLIAIFALLFAAIAAYVVRRSLQERPAPLPVAETPRLIPLATTDLEPGKPLGLADVGLASMTNAQIASRRIPPDSMSNPQQIFGRILRVPMKKGDFFIPESFYPDGSGPSIAERLQPGYRAVTVPIRGAGALAGYAMPGSIVDVVFRSTARQGTPRIPQETLTLIQGAEILALGDNSVVGKLGGIRTNSENNPVTLAVSTEDANRLKIVEGQGDLSLTLRSGDDKTVNRYGPQTLDQLLGIQKQAGPWVADVYRRGRRQSLTFENNQVVSEQFGGIPTQMPVQPDPAAAAPPTPPPAGPQMTPTLPIFPWPAWPLGPVQMYQTPFGGGIVPPAP